VQNALGDELGAAAPSDWREFKTLLLAFFFGEISYQKKVIILLGTSIQQLYASGCFLTFSEQISIE